MLKVRLRELIEETNTTINEVSEKTGISRVSLTQLANNDTKMIKFDTIDKLLDFFEIDYYDFFEEKTSGEVETKLVEEIDQNNFLIELNFNLQKYHSSNKLKHSEKILFKIQYLNRQDKVPIIVVHGISKSPNPFSGFQKVIGLLSKDDITHFVEKFINGMFVAQNKIHDCIYSINREKINLAFFIDQLDEFSRAGIIFTEKEYDSITVEISPKTNDTFSPEDNRDIVFTMDLGKSVWESMHTTSNTSNKIE